MTVLSSKYIDLDLSDVYTSLVIEYAKANTGFRKKCSLTSPSVSVITTETHNTDTNETKRTYDPLVRFPSGFTSPEILDAQQEVREVILGLIRENTL